MRFYNEYTDIVAISERSSGNDTVGNMWVETKVFNKNAPIDEVIQWAKGTSGKLIITISDPRGNEWRSNDPNVF